MHSKSDCRLLWRVVADMFIVVMAAGAKGGEVEGGEWLAPQRQTRLKIPVYMEVKQMGTLGRKQPIYPPQVPKHTQIYMYTHQCQHSVYL